MTDKYLKLEANGLTFSVKIEDEGLVLDVIDSEGEIVTTTYEFYSELGLQKTEEEK